MINFWIKSNDILPVLVIPSFRNDSHKLHDHLADNNNFTPAGIVYILLFYSLNFSFKACSQN